MNNTNNVIIYFFYNGMVNQIPVMKLFIHVGFDEI